MSLADHFAWTHRHHDKAPCKNPELSQNQTLDIVTLAQPMLSGR